MSKNIQRRLTAARNQAFGADAVFAGLVKNYEDSAKAAEAVCDEANAVVAEHRVLQRQAQEHAADARNKASKIREVFGI